MTLAIDIETYSSVDLKKSGVYKYVESPDFEILLIAYQYDNGPIQLLDMAEINDLGPDPDDIERMEDLRAAMLNPGILKTAYNAQFEITCLNKYFAPGLNPAQWRCTMARAAMLGLPLGLDFVAKALKLEVQKMTGWQHIRYFCIPCKPTQANGGRTRNRPHHNPEGWAEFKEYCKNDVRTERAIDTRIDFFQICPFEKPMFAIDQEINSTGVKIDRVLVENAIEMDRIYSGKLIAEAIQITKVLNPKSVPQLKQWIEESIGDEVENLQASNIQALIERADSPEVKRVLEIRQQISKSSIRKYQAMINCAGEGDRIRGLFQYLGANRTGRWASRLVQLHNLIKNNMKDLDLARQLVREGDLDTLEMIFGNVSRVLSQLCRTAFIPSDGNVLLVSDFAAIEARVLAWLAGETWKLEVFKGHGKIYEAVGARMFNVALEDIKKGSVERDASKISELALGYQGAVGAMTSMITSEKRKAIDQRKPWTYNPTEDEIKATVVAWRRANPATVKYWNDVNNAAINAVESGELTTVGRVAYYTKKGILFCKLPSGRELAYMRPALVPNKFGGVQIEYEGMNQTTKKWEKMRAYGGLFVENMTQAIARDLLAEKIKYFAKGVSAKICMHVHDEIVLDAPAGLIGTVNEIMARPVSWAPGLPLKGESFETTYYKKED